LIKKYFDVQFLNKEIEALTKRKNTPALAKKQESCGIFQDVKDIPVVEEPVIPRTV
jgi:hypothetical protein